MEGKRFHCGRERRGGEGGVGVGEGKKCLHHSVGMARLKTWRFVWSRPDWIGERGTAGWSGMSPSQLFQNVPSVHVASSGGGRRVGVGGGGCARGEDGEGRGRTGKADVFDEPYVFAMRPARRALQRW